MTSLPAETPVSTATVADHLAALKAGGGATIRVRPRSGIILADVPSTGADIPADLATQWIADRLVVAAPTEDPAHGIEDQGRDRGRRGANGRFAPRPASRGTGG